MIEEKIGRIKKVKFGLGGYQDGEICLEVQIEFKSSGVFGSISGGWANNTPSDNAKWTKESTYKVRSEMLDKVIEALKSARVLSISELEGKLVSCRFEESRLIEWGILTEN